MAFAVLRVDKYQNAKPMIAAIRNDYGRKGPLPIATYQFFRESTVYYAGQSSDPMRRVQVPGQSAQEGLARFLAKSRPAYVITTNEHEREINEAFPGKFQRIFDQRRFLGPGEMVVLRSKAGEPVSHLISVVNQSDKNVRPPDRCSHSYRRASMGSSREAFQAG